VRSGLAIAIATRDALLQPEIARGWGLEVAADRDAVTVCVSVAPDRQRARTSSRTVPSQ
jgi:hypothetical protein